MKKILGYTIKSTSNEGTYFLVNHWENHKAFWIEREKLKPSMLFKTSGYAKRNLKKLLSIMEDYKIDDFELVYVYELTTELGTMTVVSVIETVKGV